MKLSVYMKCIPNNDHGMSSLIPSLKCMDNGRTTVHIYICYMVKCRKMTFSGKFEDYIRIRNMAEENTMQTNKLCTFVSYRRSCRKGRTRKQLVYLDQGVYR